MDSPASSREDQEASAASPPPSGIAPRAREIVHLINAMRSRLDLIGASAAGLPDVAAEIQVCQSQLRDLEWMLWDFSQASEQLAHDARHDALTKVWNRRAFDECLSLQLAIANRYQTVFSVVLFDIDAFKQINDAHGHLVGDAVLSQLAQGVQNSVRASDLFARYGGEEFAAVLPQTGLQGAVSIAERVRKSIASTPFVVVGGEVFVNVSAGVTEFEPGDTVDSILARADAALYEAKQAGRNRTAARRGR